MVYATYDDIIGGRERGGIMHMPSLGWGGSTRGLVALIAVLMRYPEVSSVQYTPESQNLQISLVVRGRLESDQWDELKEQLIGALVTYRDMTKRPLIGIALSHTVVQDMTMLELVRDAQTLSIEEVGILIEMVRDQTELAFISDAHDLLEEDMMVQEETIHERLKAVQEEGSGQLVALRDEGRVLIFNT